MEKYSLVFLVLSQLLVASHGKIFSEILNLSPDPMEYSHYNTRNPLNNRREVIEDIYFRYYNGKTFSEHIDFQIKDANNILKEREFDNNNKTVFYVHGWREDAHKESVETVVTSYLENRPDVNVILIDWSNMASGSYMTNAALNTRLVGVAVAKEIHNMVKYGLHIRNIHVVGHSLGGQVAGFIGKSLLNPYDILLERITALDPAFPMFYPGFYLGHISKNDAKFVDVIHTSYDYGAPVPTGSVDFWPNKQLLVQPGCKKYTVPLSPDDMCSHWRSWRYWAESVKHPQAFPAKRIAIESVSHSDSNIVFMGEAASASAKGDYYLQTNSHYPFGKSYDGIQ